ncbi:hypothetical protein MSG28_000195, partial [Choristoneura fumiferana]
LPVKQCEAIRPLNRHPQLARIEPRNRLALQAPTNDVEFVSETVLENFTDNSSINSIDDDEELQSVMTRYFFGNLRHRHDTESHSESNDDPTPELHTLFRFLTDDHSSSSYSRPKSRRKKSKKSKGPPKESSSVNNENAAPSTNVQTDPPTNGERRLGDCPICMENLARGSIASTTCGHVFCLDCIKTCLRTNGKKCPTCRKTLKGVGYHLIFLRTTACPCKIRLAVDQDTKKVAVYYVCNHHDHDLTESAFYQYPHAKYLPQEVKDVVPIRGAYKETMDVALKRDSDKNNSLDTTIDDDVNIKLKGPGDANVFDNLLDSNVDLNNHDVIVQYINDEGVLCEQNGAPVTNSSAIMQLITNYENTMAVSNMKDGFLEEGTGFSELVENITDNIYTLDWRCVQETQAEIEEVNIKSTEDVVAANAPDSEDTPPPLRICLGHDDLTMLSDADVILPGAKFLTHQVFLKYINERASRWFFYYSLVESGKVPEFYVYKCVFGKHRASKNAYQAKGLRKRLRRLNSEPTYLTVVYSCNHHDHPLDAQLFNAQPHSRRLPEHIKEEIKRRLNTFKLVLKNLHRKHQILHKREHQENMADWRSVLRTSRLMKRPC